MIKESLNAFSITDHKKYKGYGMLLASLMFIWSGINKILFYDRKVSNLSNRTMFPEWLSSFGMVNVILLETIGFFILVDYYCNLNIILQQDEYIIANGKVTKKEIVKIILLLLLLFLIVVTIIYHPPNLNKPIPFLSNLTTFGLFLYVYSDLDS